MFLVCDRFATSCHSEGSNVAFSALVEVGGMVRWAVRFTVPQEPRVQVKFGRMKNRNGMPEEKRIELLRRLNAIPGVNLSE
jgi:hypothetical protein